MPPPRAHGANATLLSLASTSQTPSARCAGNPRSLLDPLHHESLRPGPLLHPLPLRLRGPTGPILGPFLERVAKEYAKRRSLGRTGNMLAWTLLNAELMRGVGGLLLSVA